MNGKQIGANYFAKYSQPGASLLDDSSDDEIDVKEESKENTNMDNQQKCT
jgi:hypothetical protein